MNDSYRIVKTFDIPVTVTVTEYYREDGTKCYDWCTNVDESPTWFDTPEEALRDAETHFG